MVRALIALLYAHLHNVVNHVGTYRHITGMNKRLQKDYVICFKQH